MLRTLFFIIFLGLLRPNEDNRWVQYASTEKFISYFDSETGIRKTDKGYFRVWVKDVPNTKHLEEIREELKNQHKQYIGLGKDGIPIYNYGDWGKYAYSLSLNEIDCNNWRMKCVEYDDYNSSGETLNSEQYDLALVQWINPRPESTGEELLKTVCSKLNQILYPANK